MINLIFFIICLFVFPDSYPLEFSSFFIPLVIFIVSFILFALKVMGAGDSKYLTTFYLMVPVAGQEDSFWYLTVSTIAIGGIFFLVNISRNIDKIIMSFKTANMHGIKQIFGTRFSFAPVVLVAWVWFGWVNKKILFY